jgi:hypothetical protein
LGKKKSNSAWPIILINFNLGPEIRTRLENLFPIAVIPGPHSPKLLDSYFAPLREELYKLARGVRTYDAQLGASFDLHAYLILFSGDLPAMSKFLCLKGHNGYAPCRFCLIRGSPLRRNNKVTYYAALRAPRHSGQNQDDGWNPRELPLRTRATLQDHLTEIAEADTQGHRDRLSTHYGINRLSKVLRIPGLSFPKSFPHDLMHLLFENICPLLQQQWTGSGKFKGSEPADAGYRLAPRVWEQIGLETAEAHKTLPSDFVGALPDISNSKYKAEFWSFWVQYIGPIVLQGRFPNDRYYRHFCDLISIIKMILQFSITHGEIDDLEEKIIKWVTEYERYVQSSIRSHFAKS